MRREIQDSRVNFIIGDIRDYDSINDACNEINYIFHAAALKQVPSCEFYPMEALKTNVIGTENVLEAAIQCNVDKVVCLSTDKAVYPINAMGISKAMMEKVIIAKSRNSLKTKIFITRYGNVMASRGSVIPLFVKQLKDGKAITVTDPEMTRFMMTLDDAVELVMYAFKNGNPGDIFVQKSPASTIGLIAETLKELYNSNSKIINIGIRHSEKVHETLLSKEERMISDDLEKYYRVPSDNRDLNYSKYFTDGEKKIAKAEDYTSHNTKQLSVNEIKDILLKKKIIAENSL